MVNVQIVLTRHLTFLAVEAVSEEVLCFISSNGNLFQLCY